MSLPKDKTKVAEYLRKLRIHAATIAENGYRKGAKFSPEQIKRLSDAHLGQKAWNKGLSGYTTSKRGKKFPHLSGENSWSWIADRSKLIKRQERNDSAYKGWRKSVRDRDGWKCKMSKIG